MQDPTALYAFEGTLDPATLRARTLVVTLTSFVDAGRAQSQFDHHVLSTLPHEVLATFDLDQLVDYRGQRPSITFDHDHFTDLKTGRLQLHHVVDESGVPFLLLTGPEPDLQWERLAAAVEGLVERFGVSTTVTLGGLPMAVPHTRPTTLTRHASSPDLIPGNEPFFSTVQMSASFPALLEVRLAEHGRHVIGLTAHIPHYVAQAEYPDATVALTQALSETTGLTIPTLALQLRANEVRQQIDQELSDSEEGHQLVSALEEQYDAVVEGRPRRGLPSGVGDLPSADDIAREAEAFLREQSQGEEPPTPS